MDTVFAVLLIVTAVLSGVADSELFGGLAFAVFPERVGGPCRELEDAAAATGLACPPTAGGQAGPAAPEIDGQACREPPAVDWGHERAARGVAPPGTGAAGGRVTADNPWESAENARRYAEFARTYPTYQQTSRHLVRLAQLAPDARVMDLACGTGVTTEAVLAVLGPDGSIVAIDGSQAMLTAVRSLVADRRVTWLRSPAERLSECAPAGLDAVVCNSAIWQTDVRATAAAVRGVLRPGGRFAFNLARFMLADHAQDIQSSDPLLDLMKTIAAREYGWAAPPASMGTSRQQLSERWLREVLDQSGFRVEQAQALNYQSDLEEQRAWLSIPIFTRRRFDGLSYEQRMAVLDQAYQSLADSPPEPATTAWIAFTSIAV
jgi:ubiquinone/menaquinone biosynthesis C-methylase UbiE